MRTQALATLFRLALSLSCFKAKGVLITSFRMAIAFFRGLSFLGLSVELRLIIYKHLLASEESALLRCLAQLGHLKLLSCKRMAPEDPRTALYASEYPSTRVEQVHVLSSVILRTCRMVLLGAMPILYQFNDFYYDGRDPPAVDLNL